MAKAKFQQTLLGRRLSEDGEKAANNSMMTFRYWGLDGDVVEIVGAWAVDDAVQVLVRDVHGRTATLYPNHFILSDGPGPNDKERLFQAVATCLDAAEATHNTWKLTPRAHGFAAARSRVETLGDVLAIMANFDPDWKRMLDARTANALT
jgi:hypothetical protein